MNDFLCNNRLRPDEVLCSRRQFLARTGMGLGVLGLAGLLSRETLAGTAGTASSPLHPQFPARAKHVIHIFAQGAPSHIDTWDPKPALAQYEDKSLPDLNGVAMPSPFKFKKYGKAGIEVSEVFSALGQHVDDMAIIRSMHTDIPAHDVATVFMNTGSLRMAKPSVGAWALYGLGSENENMPGYISLRPNGGSPPGGALNWGSAFLPGNFQASSINTGAGTVEGMIQNIRNPYFSQDEQRHQLDLVQKLNAIHARQLQKDPQLEARIESFEMAYRMQMEATDAFDIAKESQNVRDLYGSTPQGRQLLIARRLIERGVRFVQVWAGGWDHHQDIEDRLPQSAAEIDKPAAALLADLKQRSLLDSTLVIWGGEFGRTVTRDRNGNDNPGRDHNNRAFTVWLAGGGVKGGTVYGATDEFGARAVENKVHIHDLHATILRLLGFDHEKLTYRYNGRDFRLTDNFGKVVQGIIA
ncbi:MAG TPA: DUF1501 domain-containing protein [Candidatus Angelobacter sp.]|nr:DUF1501 domain-containing protein [Candidatus Angelobacter sp.]